MRDLETSSIRCPRPNYGFRDIEKNYFNLYNAEIKKCYILHTWSAKTHCVRTGRQCHHVPSGNRWAITWQVKMTDKINRNSYRNHCHCTVTKIKSHQNRPRRPRGGEEVQIYSSFNLGSRWDGWSTPFPVPFTSGKKPGTHCIGGWVAPRAGLDWQGKSRSRRDSIPGPSKP